MFLVFYKHNSLQLWPLLLLISVYSTKELLGLMVRWSNKAQPPMQRTLTIRGNITVQLTSYLTGLDLTKQIKLF